MLRLQRVAEATPARRGPRRCRRRAGGRPASIFIRVDLPAPFSPTRACTWPARRSRSTSVEDGVPGEGLGQAAGSQHHVGRGAPAAAGPRCGGGVVGQHGSTVTRFTHFCREACKSCLLDVSKSPGASLRGVRTSDVFEILRDGPPRTRAQLARDQRAGPVDHHRAGRDTDAARARGPAATRSRPAVVRRRCWRSTPPPASWPGSTSARPTHARRSPTWPGRAGRAADRPRHRRRARAGAGLGHRDHRDAAARRGPQPRRPRRHRHGAARAGGALDRPGDQPADHARLGPVRRPGHVQRELGVPVADRQRRQHHGAGGAARPPSPTSTTWSSSRSPPASAPASSPAATCSAGRRAPPATSATSGSRRRRRVVPVRQQGLPGGDRRRAGAGRPRSGAPGVDAADGHDVVELTRAGDRSAIQAVRQAGRDLGEVRGHPGQPDQPVGRGHRRRAGHRAGENLLAGIREVVDQRSLPLATEQLRLLPSAAGRAGRRDRCRRAGDRPGLSPEAIESAAIGSGSVQAQEVV